MQLKVKKLHPDAIIPQYATDGSACFDLCALNSGMTIVGKPAVVDTGLAFEVPEGCVMLVFSRSGHGFKNDVRLANCVGVIDSDYRGEVKVKLTTDSHISHYAVGAYSHNAACACDGSHHHHIYAEGQHSHAVGVEAPGFYYKAGDRIAQAMIVPIIKAQLVEAEELSSTERGEGGFGSTGVK